MRLHRDLGVTQKTAWFMLQRIREALREELAPVFEGPAEVDEAYFWGPRKEQTRVEEGESRVRNGR